MTDTFTKWDVTEHLRNHEDARLYLEACADEDPGDGSLIRAALNDIARAGNMSRLARDAGMTREGLCEALSENGNPTFATIVRIARTGNADEVYRVAARPDRPAPAVPRGPSSLRRSGGGSPAERRSRSRIRRASGTPTRPPAP